MSTRATYEFMPSGNGLKANKTAVYIHYDGYPEGAAVYFWTALRTHPNKGCPATQFIRANPEAELTGSHETHGDTEFRYTIDGDRWEDAGIKAEKRYGKEWVAFYVGSVVGFLEKYPKMLEGFDAFKTVTLRYSRALKLNTETARPFLASAYGHLEIWSKNPALSRTSANWQSCEEDTRTIVAAFPALAAGIDPAIVDLAPADATIKAN